MEPLSPEPPPVTRAPPPPIDVSTPLSSIPSPANLLPPSLSSTQNLSELKSFKDTLIDGNATISQPLVTYEELVAANQTLEPPAPMLEDGDAPTQVKVPKVRIPKEIWQRLCTPWKNAVIIKLLGKSINFHVLHARLLKEWRTEHEFEIIDPWEPGFHPARAKAPKTAVWVKLFGVPILCFYEAICMYLGSKIGKPIKVDPTTLLATRGQYARVCVEVDLSQPLPSSVDLDLEDLPQSLILVDYEGLHKICFHCGEFGHKMEFCRFKNPGKPSPVSNPNAKTMVELTQSLKPDPVDNNMVFGPWMVQQKKQRRRSQPHRSAEQLTGGDGSSQPLNTGNSNSVPSTSAKVVGLDRRAKSSAPTKSRTNRFEVIAEIMEEDSNLHISNKGKDTSMEGSAPQDMTQPLITSPMDITLLPDHTAPQDVDAKARVGQPAPTTINSPELALAVITWNSRGVQHGPFRRECKELLKMHKPDVICFLETKADDSVKALEFMKQFRFDQQFRVPSQGRAGGLWLFWKSSSIYLEVLDINTQFIHCSLSQHHISFIITFAYVQPHGEMKSIFWDKFIQLAPTISGSWIAMGDFNDIASAGEASPRAGSRFVRAQRFRDRLAQCGLHSKESLGCAFTWVRKINGRVSLREKLDRALFNLSALEAYPEAKIINRPRLCSDHHPVMLCVDTSSPVNRNAKPMRFEAAWLTYENFGTVFSEAWSAHSLSLPDAISSVRETCIQWNRDVFGDIFKKKKALTSSVGRNPKFPILCNFSFFAKLGS
ncbi:hypothetical protein SLEP1_g36998 [Rubroshorea leprosula]|uniref:CCHC-type domain-containing protein n=1 Tax=Rubroshorea leprosula TaxID=152421 RepID=A0AAV5KTY7_9ROSI|nr:hypothetical protein SLEP1_g36998 [Rubroshorea leprosula]